MLRNARNLEELVGIKVLQADGLLGSQQQNGNNQSSATTPNQTSVYDPRFDPIHFSQKVPCMGNRQFLINQAILSSSQPSQKVHLGGKSRDPKRVVTASTDGTMATRFPEFHPNKLQSVGSTNSFKQFQESCGQNPLSKKTQSQSYAPNSRIQNSQIPTAFLENIGQESNQENEKQNIQSDQYSQVKENEEQKESKSVYIKEADPIKALKTIFQQKNKKRRVPLDVNEIASKYKKKMQEKQNFEQQQLHSRGVTTASNPNQLGSYFESYMQGKIFTPQSHYLQQGKVFKEDQLYEENKELQNFEQNIYIQQNAQHAQQQQKPFSPTSTQQENSQIFSQQSQRPIFQNNQLNNQQIQNLDIRQRLENLRKLFEEDDINNAVQEIQNEWLLEEKKAQYSQEKNNYAVSLQNQEGGKQINILQQKKVNINKRSPAGIPTEDQDFPINDLRKYLTDKIKNVQKRSQPNDIITNNNRVPLELPKDLQKQIIDENQNQDQQQSLKFQFKASTLTHISEIKQIGQEKIENQFVERIFKEQIGYQYEQFQLKQQKEMSKQIIHEKRRNQKKFLSHQQKDSWKSKNDLQNIDEKTYQKKHQIYANMQNDLFVIENQQSSEDTKQSHRQRKKKQKHNVIQEQMMRIDRINRGIPEPQKVTNQDVDYSKYVPSNGQIYMQAELVGGSSFTQQIANDAATGSIQTNYTHSDNQGAMQMFQNYHDSGTGYILQPGVDSRPTPMTQILRHNINNEDDQSYNQTSIQSPLNRMQDQHFQAKNQSNEKSKNEDEKIKDNVLIIHPSNYQFQHQVISPGKTLVTSQQKTSFTKSLAEEQLASGQGTFDNSNQLKNNSQNLLHTQQILMNLPQHNIFFGSKQNGVNDFRVSQIVQEYNNKHKVKEVQQFENEDDDQGFPNYLSDTELFMRTRNQFIKRDKTAESRGGGYRQKAKGKKDRSNSPFDEQFKLLNNQKQMFFKQRLEEIYNARINQHFLKKNQDIQLSHYNQQQEIVHGSHFQYFCPKRFNRYPRFTIFFKKDQILDKDKTNLYNNQNTVSLSPQFLSYLMDKSASGVNSNPTEAITSSLKQNQKLKIPQQTQKSPKQNDKQNASVDDKEIKQRSTLSSDVSPIRYGVQNNPQQQEINQNKMLVGGDDAIQSWNLYNDNVQSYDPFQKVILVKGIDNSILTSFRTLKRENNTVSDTFKIVHKKFQPNKNKGLMKMMKGHQKFGGIINFNNNKYQLPDYPFTDNEYAMEIGQAQLIAESFLQQQDDSILNAHKDGMAQIQQKQFSTSNVSKSPIYHDIHGNQIESDNSVIQQISGFEKQKKKNIEGQIQQQTQLESKINNGGITGISQQSSIGLGVSNIPAAYEISQFEQKNTQNIEEVISKVSPKTQEAQEIKKGFAKKKIQENIFISHKHQSPLRQSVDNEYKASLRTNTGMLRGAIYSQNNHLIQLKNAIDFQNIDQLNQNEQNNKKVITISKRDQQNNKHQIEVMVLSKVDPFDFAFPAHQSGPNESALASSNYHHQNMYLQSNFVNQIGNGQKQLGQIQIQSPQSSYKQSQIGKRNPFSNLVKGGTTSQAANILNKHKKQDVDTFNSNNDYFKHINKQKLIDEQRVQTVNKAEQEQKSFGNEPNSGQDKQRGTHDLHDNVDLQQDKIDLQQDEKIQRIQVDKMKQNQKNKDNQKHQAIYKLSSQNEENSGNKGTDKNLQIVIEQNRPKSKGHIHKNFKQPKMSTGIDQQKLQNKYGKDFKIPQLPELLQNQLFLNNNQDIQKQNQGQLGNNQQYKIKKFIDEIYQKEAKNRYHKQYVREDFLSPHCPIFNLEKFHQLKPKDELANMGLKNKFGVINKQAIDDGIVHLDQNGQPTIYHPSQSLSNVLGFQAGGPHVKPSQIIRLNENQQKQMLLNQQSGLPALFGSQISYRQTNQNQSPSENNVSNQIFGNANQRQSLHLQNQTSGETIGGQASVKDQSKIKSIGNKQLKIPQSNYIIHAQQSQNQIQQTDENLNLKATFDGRVEITSEVDQNEVLLRQSGQLYKNYGNPNQSQNKIQTGEHDIENVIYQNQSNHVLSQN